MVDVSLGSHVHQIPQTGLPQIGPVIITMVQKRVPLAADEDATRSHISFRVARNAMDAIRVTKNARKATHAEGT